MIDLRDCDTPEKVEQRIESAMRPFKTLLKNLRAIQEAELRQRTRDNTCPKYHQTIAGELLEEPEE